jgi:hypothetical protein
MARNSKMKAVYAAIAASSTYVGIAKGKIVAARVMGGNADSDQAGYRTFPATKELLAACDKAADLASVKCQIRPDGVADVMNPAPADPLGTGAARRPLHVDGTLIGTVRSIREIAPDSHPAMRWETVREIKGKTYGLGYFEAA